MFKSFLICCILVFLPNSSDCQLNLPAQVFNISANPEISLNSYNPNQVKSKYEQYFRSNIQKPHSESGFEDLSQRFGPPYSDVLEDRENNDNYEQVNIYDRHGSKINNDNHHPTLSSRFFEPHNQDFQDNYYGPFRVKPIEREEMYRRHSKEEENILKLLLETDYRGSLECTANVAAQWTFETNINEATETNALLAQYKYADYERAVFHRIQHIDARNIYDPNVYRLLRLLSKVGPNSLPPDQLDRYNRIISDMLAIYNTATICEYQKPFRCGATLQTDLREIMARSRNWEELQYTWSEYHRKTGKPIKDLYEQLVDIVNEIAHYNNYTNAGEYWFSGYETFNFREDLEYVWLQVQPLYELLHAYVRRKLREYYGPDKISRNSPIPVHILGHMHGQTWNNVIDIIVPYPGKNFIDVTPNMLEQGYTPLIMFQLAEEFFLSLNMSVLPANFWVNSILEQPPHHPIICQPSAWDFCNRKDFRIKMCTRISHRDLIATHREMAHIQYFLAYKNQPKIFRDGPNPGFHEAVAGAIELSVSTPKHLQSLGLIQSSLADTSYDINYLFATAIDKVAFLPFALALDAWRYDIFSKKVSEGQNCHYWNLREKYGGVKPPELRSEMDFDPGAKYHIPANIPYIKYFVGTILQFQLYRAMCKLSKQYDPFDPQKPLHKCDIYRQPEAGNLLKKLMENGASQQWQHLLEEVIGENRLDGSALLEYFRPLEEWLRNENLRNQEFVGWTYDGDYCKRSIETANLQVSGGFYNSSFKKKEDKNLILSMIIIIITVIHENRVANFLF